MTEGDGRGGAAPARLGPLDLRRSANAALRPAPVARLGPGFWGDRRQLNSDVRIPGAIARLTSAGNLHDLELAAGRASGAYRGDLPFLDSDVYKWIEAAAWDRPDRANPETEAFSATLIELLAEAQRDDGYLHSYFQVHRPGERYVDLQWGHELYCTGHLVQAAIARSRAVGDDRLLEIATRLVGSVSGALGPGRREAVEGHPGIEMALVELYRLTGAEEHLALAQLLLDRRGHGLLGVGRFGAAYWQDETPVRESRRARGHAVRQLYLLCGVVDTYLETGERALFEAAEAQWHDLVATKTYLTGGQGSRHSDESLGDPFELPPDRAYCETCAAIASVMLSWRLLLASGEARYGDLIERTLYNGFLSGGSLDGEGYRYINALQVRHAHALAPGDQGPYFSRWFRCACCPPNVMRTLASIAHYACATRPDGLALHQYFAGEFGDGSLEVRVETNYPWSGTVELTVLRATRPAATIALRIPQWATTFEVALNGEPLPASSRAGWLELRRDWREGDRFRLALALPARLTRADPRVDAVRGTVAVERGPLVYCVEEADNPGVCLDDVVAVQRAEALQHDAALLGGITPVRIEAEIAEHQPASGWWPYGPSSSADGAGSPDGPASSVDGPRRHVSLAAIPFSCWGNRTQGAMRVFIPSPEAPVPDEPVPAGAAQATGGVGAGPG